MILKGEIGGPINPLSRCAFHPRCPYAIERYRRDLPALVEVAPGRQCHLAQELSPAGISKVGSAA